ncbi:polysaccharide biosynthesis/export family protein [Akkermansiaceae bacterium]|nr:polysaccharide biosynthesis/export family protein [Akkermansiaceae bacterium]
MIKKFLFALFLLSITSASAVIQTGDVLILSIKGVPVSEKGTIEGEYVVGKDGQIKVPLADVMVKARGLEHEQLARSVENAFKKAGIYSRPYPRNRERRGPGSPVWTDSFSSWDDSSAGDSSGG